MNDESLQKYVVAQNGFLVFELSSTGRVGRGQPNRQTTWDAGLLSAVSDWVEQRAQSQEGQRAAEEADPRRLDVGSDPAGLELAPPGLTD